MIWLALLLALANPPEETAPPPSESSSRATAGLSLRIEHAKPRVADDVEKVGDAVNALFNNLVDLQNQVYDELDRHSSRLGLTPGHRVRVRVDDRLFVHVEVIERDGDRATLRVKVDDERQGADPGNMRVALSSGGEARELSFAQPGEVVIDDLSVSEQHQLHVFLGEEDALLIWIGDETEGD